MAMKIGQNGIAVVKAFESCMAKVPGRPGYFKAYVDPVGVLTIGWGHTNHHEPKFTASTVWSQAECDTALVRDLAIFEAHVNKLAKVTLTQNEFDALVSWAYNTGGPSTATVWKRLNAGDKAAVPAELDKWNRGGGKVLNGLVRRRKAEGQLFRGDVAGAYATAQISPVRPVVVTPAKRPEKPAGAGGTSKAGAVIVAAPVILGGAVAAQQGVSAIEIIAWIGGLTALSVAIFVIGYRIIKGAWPWKSTSTGAGSQVQSPPLLPSLEPSSELHSAASQDQLALASAALSVASQATPSQKPLASKRRRKRSAKPSSKIPTLRRKSSKSKPTVAKKSSPKRKSKSKG